MSILLTEDTYPCADTCLHIITSLSCHDFVIPFLCVVTSMKCNLDSNFCPKTLPHCIAELLFDPIMKLYKPFSSCLFEILDFFSRMVEIRKRKGGRDGSAGGVDSNYDNAKNRRSKGKAHFSSTA